MASSRYTVAIHVLTLLARGGDAPATSGYIASSVNTNPVVIRRLMASLRAARLVASQPGPGGGWHLARPAQGITLRDVYRAVEEQPVFALPSAAPNPRCPVGGRIHQLLTRRFAEAQLVLEQDLQTTTVADLLRDLKKSSR